MAEQEIDLWVERITREEMPLFTRTVQCVAGTASKDESSFSDLARSILQDPTLTAQILKMSNSMYYNPYSKRINTVSRAVMRLGFDTVKGMCLSIALMETVLSSIHREKVAAEIARAFHAAAQAKNLAVKRGLARPEEVFIAALLTRIGQIAFWCFAGEIGDKLECAQKMSKQEDQAEVDVLGFKLDRLSVELSREWKLSDLMESVLQNRNTTDPRVECISIACGVAQGAEKSWHSAQVRKEIRRVCDFLKVDEDDAEYTLHAAARIAAEITESYGAKKSSRLIPVPGAQGAKTPEKKSETLPQYPKPDAQVQLTSLKDLSTLVMNRKGDMNMVLSILLEGIYRGIGMDRVMFALLSPDRQYLVGKFGLGWSSEKDIIDFKVGANSSKPNIFGYILKNLKPLWVTEDPGKEILSLMTKEFSDQMIGIGPFFAMPISIKNMNIGVVYADRNLSGRELDEESFDAFTFFGQQAGMCLSALAG